MKRPSWSEVLSAPEHELFSVASEFAYDETAEAIWVCPRQGSGAEWVSDLSPDERRMFALFCILAERGGR